MLLAAVSQARSPRRGARRRRRSPPRAAPRTSPAPPQTDSESLFLDGLTYADLEALKARKGRLPAVPGAGPVARPPNTQRRASPLPPPSRLSRLLPRRAGRAPAGGGPVR